MVELSLRAWEPVFTSLRNVLGDEVFLCLHPDWRSAQAQSVTTTCTSTRMSVCVAVEADAAVGFVAFAADQESRWESSRCSPWTQTGKGPGSARR